MKTKLIFLLPITAFLFLFSGCKDKDDDDSREDKENAYVNSWIYEQMDLYYYWNKNLPDIKKTNTYSSPNDYFEGLLYMYKQKNGDRFSWIQENYVDLLNSLSGVSRDVGFEYITYTYENSSEAEFCVLYTKENTDAATKLKRGEFITHVDGTAITKENYPFVMAKGSNSYKLTVVNPETNILRTEDIRVVENYKENPIYYTNIYEVEGKKIGYIVYNFFAADNGENNRKYDLALAQKFLEFKQAGITDLILDLRYNGGGLINSAVYMASAIVPNRKEKIDDPTKFFARSEYNDDLQAYYKREYGADALNYYFENGIEEPALGGAVPVHRYIPELGIEKLHVIATRFSASASELIINGLRAYMPVVLIGETTVGKNVGSYSLYKENDNRNKWGMQPIVLKLFNKNGDLDDYPLGFTPDNDKTVEELRYVLGQLGDEDELLLSTAIAAVTGKVKKMKTTKVGAGLNYIQGSSSLDCKPDAYQMFTNDIRLKNLDLKTVKNK
ncbi:MAG: S41 family peptidase [Dysgonomonas sp.]|nr:S41 family peptidase [Dysgonomonas sp.]